MISPNLPRPATRRLPALRMISTLVLSLAFGHASAFSSLYAFGDSLTDTGNIKLALGIPLAPYEPGGRFSDGPIWIDALAAGLGLSASPALAGGTNYAIGSSATGTPPGSTAPTMQDQLGFYVNGYAPLGLAPNSVDPDALYVVWGGANDVRAGSSANSVSNLEGILTTLIGLGANNFLVPNLPDIGLTPESIAGGTTLQTSRTAATIAFNAGLASMTDSLRTTHGVSIIDVDVYSFINDAVANPGAYGFTVTNAPCYTGEIGMGGAGTVCSNPDEYVFWDGYHPGSAASTLLGNYAVTAVPVPAVGWIVVLVLAWLGVRGRLRMPA